MNSTANKIRPKVINAGMVALTGCCNAGSLGRRDYGRSTAGLRTIKSLLTRPRRRQAGFNIPFGLAKQSRLLPAGALLGFDGGIRSHVEHAARRHRPVSYTHLRAHE